MSSGISRASSFTADRLSLEGDASYSLFYEGTAVRAGCLTFGFAC
jgi:hypothetical protein